MKAYRIKPLEWEVTSAGFCSADTPFGRYEVFDYYAGNHAALFYYKSSKFGNNLLQNNGHSLVYAKAVCEDHWERLMKRALEEV